MNKIILFKEKLPQEIKLLFKVFLAGSILFLIGRLIFLLFNANNYSVIDFLQSVFIGFRLDTVINAAVLLFVVMILFLTAIFKKVFILRMGLTMVAFFYALALYLVLADIVFYTHYKTHITKSALHWIDSPMFMVKMIFGEIKNVLFFIFYLFIAALFFRIIAVIGNQYKQQPKLNKYNLAWLVVLIPFLFLGIRGRLASKSTINWSVAVFSKNQTLNMAAINPVYYFLKSFSWKSAEKNLPITTLPYKASQQLIKESVTTPHTNAIYKNIITSQTDLSKGIKKYNIVIIISESLGTSKLMSFSNGKALTPFTDSLALNTIYFKNFYADGIHTFNGVYSTLTGMPALPLEHPLKQYASNMAGIKLPQIFSDIGYFTTFYTTHDKLFDNQFGFAKLCGFENVVSQENFAKTDVIGVTGVPDHVLFNKAIADFNKTQSHFFACILTGTDHPPFDIPSIQGFVPTFNKASENATAYADWALSSFLNQCKKMKWFNNTIFIITGDHGAIVNSEQDMYLSKLSVPLIIYAPGIYKSINKIENLGGQIDIPATILGMLNIPYVNTSLGIDLFKQKRKFLSATYDETLLSFSEQYFYVHRKQSPNFFTINDTLKYCTPLLCKSKDCLQQKLFPFCIAKVILEQRRNTLFQQ